MVGMERSTVEELSRGKIAPIAVSDEATVVATYEADATASDTYQSEAQLEDALIAQLQAQAYDYADIRDEAALVANLRTQLEALNNIHFTDAEWKTFFETSIASANEGPKEKTWRLHNANTQLLQREDGTTKNIRLLDKTHIHNNKLQVINQYAVDAGTTPGAATHSNRYDVTILVNGLPLIHIELKRRGVNLREAFNQIARYQNQSLWAGHGLFDYVQVFVISNGTLTKYYSNTTRPKPTDNTKRTPNTWAFTCWWADSHNKVIPDLNGFTRTFFAKHTILNILTKYCVLREDGNLLVMRPYQIAATERILQRIDVAANNKMLGTTQAGGYIWHTTGSGKTLTSFKTAQLATALPSNPKVLFVVDRKDLDYQTMREYDSFKKGAANSNTSTKILTEQMGDPNARIIITTIQKLSNFVAANAKHPIYNEHTVIIFDECHRSQFGEMHNAITKKFKKYNIFGFTGTPIFRDNAGKSYGARDGRVVLRTTEETFGEQLHTYTIVDAIEDKNVLPFKLAYNSVLARAGGVVAEDASRAQEEAALMAPERISAVTSYILKHFNQHTRRLSETGESNTTYIHTVTRNTADVARTRGRGGEAITVKRRVNGFNAMMAVQSVEAAKLYYNEFKAQQAELPEHQQLKVATIFSYGANEDPEAGILAEEGFDTRGLSGENREFLDTAIADYNQIFGTSYDANGDNFQNYYRDLSMRVKDREVDLLLVVNMFLTGFDAPTLNTLYVDKNLKYHGLIQAFSRTNRILNQVKRYGNIVCFRDLQENTEDALALFGNADAQGIALLEPYEHYLEQYRLKVAEMLAFHAPGAGVPASESEQRHFAEVFGEILKLRNLLAGFDEFPEDDDLTPRDIQDLQSVYLAVRDELRADADANEPQPEQLQLVFEIELMRQVEVNVDYILMLVEKFREPMLKSQVPDYQYKEQVIQAVESSPTLRDKRDLFMDFIELVNTDASVAEQWVAFISQRREQELGTLIEEERLREPAARDFMESAFDAGEVPRIGTDIGKVLPRMSFFGNTTGGESRAEVKERVLDKMTEFLERYEPLG